jgi:hypothetical protein
MTKGTQYICTILHEENGSPTPDVVMIGFFKEAQVGETT